MSVAMLPHQTAEWQALVALSNGPQPTIHDLFADERRLAELVVKSCGICFDFSRLPISHTILQQLLQLADAADLAGWQRKLADGAIVNLSEGRAATHMQLRDPAHMAQHQPMLVLAQNIRNGGFGPVSDIIHIGIGGSALGPHLLVDALGDPATGGEGSGPRIHVATNIDGAALARIQAVADPATTLIIAVSKSFTTQEMLVNLDAVRSWMRNHGVADPEARMIAVTAAPEKAAAHGAIHILDFAESVGGRYSLWSAVGLPLAVRAGPQLFEALLDGARQMDLHFLEAPFAANAPVLAALADVWHACFLHQPSRAVFAYDERLRLLVPYLQQLEMESNGKSVARDGSRLPFPTAPVTWGGVGTDAQHALFQLLHQGAYHGPVEFVAVATPGHGLDPIHHRLLLSNCFAQGAALMRGRSCAEANAESGGDPALTSARVIPGDRGSSTILLDRLSAERLGALLAFYEARTFAAGVLMGINSFDQWGVELGKQLARQLESGTTEGFDPSTRALMQETGLLG